MNTRSAQEAVQQALDILRRASSDWRNPDVAACGSVHWPVAVSHARRLLGTALLALAGAEDSPMERQRVLTVKGSPAEALVGMSWYNGLTRAERMRWHEATGSAVPADCWRAYQRGEEAYP